MALVWEAVDPANALKLVTELRDLMRALGSWAWIWPGTRVARSNGWTLQFEITVDRDCRHVTMLLWPEPDANV